MRPSVAPGALQTHWRSTEWPGRHAGRIVVHSSGERNNKGGREKKSHSAQCRRDSTTQNAFTILDRNPSLFSSVDALGGSPRQYISRTAPLCRARLAGAPRKGRAAAVRTLKPDEGDRRRQHSPYSLPLASKHTGRSPACSAAAGPPFGRSRWPLCTLHPRIQTPKATHTHTHTYTHTHTHTHTYLHTALTSACLRSFPFPALPPLSTRTGGRSLHICGLSPSPACTFPRAAAGRFPPPCCL